MANEEQRLSRLKQKVIDLKTTFAVKKDNADRLLRELKEEGIKSADDALKKLPKISKEIDEMEAERDEKLEEAESYLDQYNV